MQEIQYGWAIFEKDESDYLLWSAESNSIIELDKLPIITPAIIEYNQLEFEKEFGRNLCTDYAPKWMFSNNSWIKLNQDDRYKLAKNRYHLDDFSPPVWGRLDKWVMNVIDTLNDGIMYRVHKSTIIKLIEKWYTINIWIYIGNDLKLAYWDGRITEEEIKNIKDNKWGHSTLIKPKSDWQDSYVGIKQHNISKIENLAKFLSSWFVYDWGYIIIPNNIIKEYFKKNIITRNYIKDANYWVELMKNKKMYPREFKVYQELLKEFKNDIKSVKK